MIENKKGISLIILIITIIIVIILAGSVLLNLSETNVISNAGEAVILNDVGEFKIELDLYQMEKYMANNGSYFPNKLNANATSATYDGNNIDGITMYDIIPSMENKSNYIDFEIQDGELVYTGEDENIQNMLAGNDESGEDPIPIVEIDTIATENSTIDGTAFAYNNPIIPKDFKAVNTIDASWDDMEYNNGLVIEDINGNQFVWVPVDGINLEYKKFTSLSDDYVDDSSALPDDVTSEIYQINKYSGFYIARYESGNNSSIPISKKDVSVWNNINYYSAVSESKQMYTTGSIRSALVTGTQWDTVVTWIENSGKNVNDCSLWANYDSLQLTGSSDTYKAKNIYNLAGNVQEWSSEMYTGSDGRQGRAGSYYIDYSVVARLNAGQINSRSWKGFRVVMYIL